MFSSQVGRALQNSLDAAPLHSTRTVVVDHEWVDHEIRAYASPR